MASGGAPFNSLPLCDPKFSSFTALPPKQLSVPDTSRVWWALLRVSQDRTQGVSEMHSHLRLGLAFQLLPTCLGQSSVPAAGRLTPGRQPGVAIRSQRPSALLASRSPPPPASKGESHPSYVSNLISSPATGRRRKPPPRNGDLSRTWRGTGFRRQLGGGWR